MSVGKNLNEMENIEENQVTKGAAAAEAMPIKEEESNTKKIPLKHENG